MITFKEFEKEIKTEHSVIKDWEISLPFNTDFQPIIALARNHERVNWHVKVGEVTEKNPEPTIKMYWDKESLESS